MKSKDKDKTPEKIEETNRELFKFASGVAQAQRFFPEVQPAWKEFSKKIISEFADKINSLFAEDFKIDEEVRAPASATQSVMGRAYVYLCNARHLFAKNQSQMRPEKSIKYGRFAERYVTDSILFLDQNPGNCLFTMLLQTSLKTARNLQNLI